MLKTENIDITPFVARIILEKLKDGKFEIQPTKNGMNLRTTCMVIDCVMEDGSVQISGAINAGDVVYTVATHRGPRAGGEEYLYALLVEKYKGERGNGTMLGHDIQQTRKTVKIAQAWGFDITTVFAV